MLSFKQYLNECSRWLVEASTDRRFWFHSKTKKLVKITAIWHDWGVIENPETFGLKQSQVFEFEAEMKKGVDAIGGIRRLMRIGGWRPLLIQRIGAKPAWSIQAVSTARDSSSTTPTPRPPVVAGPHSASNTRMTTTIETVNRRTTPCGGFRSSRRHPRWCAQNPPTPGPVHPMSTNP